MIEPSQHNSGKTSFLHAARLFGISVVIASLVGCANLVAPPYSADYEALDQLKAAKPGKAQVAAVKPIEADAPVNRISLRGAVLEAPGGTFSQYLQEALVRDLKEIGAFDAMSDTRIDATVLKNDIDVRGISTGSGVMEVEILITRASGQRLKKVYQTATQFESSFAGAVAVMKGQTEYANLVRALLKQIYSDPAFVSALRS